MDCILKILALGAGFVLLTGFGPRNVDVSQDGFVAADQLKWFGDASGPAPAGLQKCGGVPGSVTTAMAKMRAYKNGCAHIRNSTKPMAINDYSSGKPMIYVFSSSGSCIGKAPIAWGQGLGKVGQGKPMPCAGGGQRFTPPGFHLTMAHTNGGKYGPDDAMLLVGLDGQNSRGRTILIHKKGPIGGTTWGCTGVNPTGFTSIQKILGTGSLVYNYFGSAPLANGCETSAGMNPNSSSCVVDGYGGGGGPSSRGRRGRTTR